jgi:hypothetical protein
MGRDRFMMDLVLAFGTQYYTAHEEDFYLILD